MPANTFYTPQICLPPHAPVPDSLTIASLYPLPYNSAKLPYRNPYRAQPNKNRANMASMAGQDVEYRRVGMVANGSMIQTWIGFPKSAIDGIDPPSDRQGRS